MINTSTIHYNPTGPGDYELPSTFGKLPPPKKSRARNLSMRNDPTASIYMQKNNKQLVKNNPSFSIGHKIEDTRVYKNYMNQFLGHDTPGVGQYSPIKEGLEDKAIIRKLKKKYNMYSNKNGQSVGYSKRSNSKASLSQL